MQALGRQSQETSCESDTSLVDSEFHASQSYIVRPHLNTKTSKQEDKQPNLKNGQELWTWLARAPAQHEEALGSIQYSLPPPPKSRDLSRVVVAMVVMVAMVAHAFNSRTREAEAGGSL